MVWHSLSACGFASLAPKQLGSIGCHIQPPAAVRVSGHLGTRRLTFLIHIKAWSQKTARCEELEEKVELE
ncbi:hypothetical protein EYF80_027112 [Liparis tanakae]|uniref:Uncharacterized protein n=1 Tax=Liparis tanakae TaxID=230148 RepID=A0A4Z2HAN1_9TELE|nr:hypothetical protein EYF80_027112 [Liparis tanakae]